MAKNEEFLIEVKADIDKAAAQLKKLSLELEKTGTSGRDSGRGLDASAGSLRTLLGLAGAYIGLNTVGTLISEADAWNQLQARIQTATRSTGDYVQVSESLYRITQQNGQSLDTTVSLFQSLARVGPELGATNQDMLRLTNTVQQLGVISGTTAAQQSAGLLQFSQGLAAGVFRAEEFNSVLENLPELAVRIAQGMNMTVGELRQAVLAGEVLSQDVFDATQSQAAEIAQQAAAIPLSVDRASVQLKNSFAALLSQIDQSVGATSLLAEGMRRVSEGADYARQILQETELAEAQRKRAEAMVEYQNIRAKGFEEDDVHLRKLLADIDALDERIKSLQPAPADNLIDGAIADVEAQIEQTYARSAELMQLMGQQREMLAEQWSSADDNAVLADQQAALDAYSQSMQDFIDRLDPASAATRALHADLATLNRLFFDEGAISGSQYDQLSNALLGTARAAKQATQELDTMDRAMDLIEQQFAALDEAEARNIAGLGKLGDTGRETMSDLEIATRGFGNQFTNTLAEMVTSGEVNFKQLADSIISDLLRMAIQLNITKPLLDAVFKTPAAGGGGGGGTTPAPTNHSGGVVGTHGVTRHVSPLVFTNAPRYHSGGIVGLRPNEVPSILERGEEVLTRDDPRHRYNQRSDSARTVRVEIKNQGNPIEASSSDVRFDGESMVVSIVTRDIQRGGPINNLLQSTYKLNRGA